MSVGRGFEWFVAWRYLKQRERGAGSYLFVAAGVLLAVVVGAFVLSAKTAELGEAAALGARDWKQVYSMIGTGTLVVFVLVFVFAVLYRYLSIFATIPAFGVWLGTSALIIVLSVMNGFEVDLRQKILGQTAHILVSKEQGEFAEYREIGENVGRVSGVVAYSPYVTSEVAVSGDTNYASGGVIVKGIDPKTVGQVSDLEKNLENGVGLESLWPQVADGAQGDDGANDDDQGPEDFSSGATAPRAPEHGQKEKAGAATRSEDDEPVDFSQPSGARAVSPSPRAPGSAHHAADERVGELLKQIGATPLEPIDLAPDSATRRAPPAGLPGVLVGRELARSLRLGKGQEVKLVSPLGQDTPLGQVPRVGRFRVAGEFYSGMYEYDNGSVFVTITALQEFLSLGDRVDGIEIKVKNMEDTESVMTRLRARLGTNYRVQDWKELNRSLFAALKLEKIAMFLVLAIIILVASFAIISNLIMVVVEKSKEIAILKSMGAADRAIMRVFMIEGLYIGLVGAGLGLVVGTAGSWAIGFFGISLNTKVYYIHQLPVAMDPLAIVLVVAAGVLVSFVATIYPSYTAARLRPVAGLRYG